jgi:hypothetical protein
MCVNVKHTVSRFHSMSVAEPYLPKYIFFNFLIVNWKLKMQKKIYGQWQLRRRKHHEGKVISKSAANKNNNTVGFNLWVGAQKWVAGNIPMGRMCC